MKTTRMYILLINLLLLTAIQAVAVEYKSTYRGVHSHSAYSHVATRTVAPSYTFQSTSPYSGQWQTGQQTSMLNSDGSIANDPTANSPFSSGPRKDPSGGPGTPGGDLDPESQQPLGDAVLPLLLLAAAYIVLKRTRWSRRGREIDYK